MRIIGPAVLAMLLLPTGAAAQDSATVTGHVRDLRDTPVAGASIGVADGPWHAVTGADGSYELRLAPARTTLRAVRVGSTMRTSAPVDVLGGAHPVVDLVLETDAIDETGMGLVVGDRPAPRGGASPETPAIEDTLRIAQVPRAAVTTATELLTARSPSLIVRASSGVLGAGSRVYTRGVSSINYRTAPLVVVDGVRYVADADALSLDVGGQTPSRLDDLDPEEIEEVVVLPGPAAAARYGTEGANGVIEVRTRSSGGTGIRAGGFVEAGMRDDPARYPDAWSRPGTLSTGGTIVYCTLTLESLGRCTPLPGGLGSINRSEPTLRTGASRRARAWAEGGSSRVQGRLSADLGRADGVREDESWERRRLHATALLRPRDDLEVELSGLQANGSLELPHGDDSLLGYQFVALALGPGDERTPPPHVPPVSQDATHATLGGRAQWSPLGWLQLGARGGVDRSTRDDSLRAQIAPDALLQARGEDRWIRRTWAGWARMRTRPFRTLGSTTLLEVERWSDHRSQSRRSMVGGATQEEGRDLRRSALGLLAVQQIEGGAWGATATVRREELDPEKQAWSGSVGAEVRPGWALPLGAGLARVRAAYGWVQRARPFDFDRDCGEFGCDGNPTGGLAREMEGGIDLKGSGNAELALTAYRRVNDEPLWALSASASRFTIRNTGLEAALRTAERRVRGVAWSAELLAWVNRNRVTDLASPLVFNQGSQRIREGEPLGGYIGRRIVSFADADHDGIISSAGCPGPSCEVQFADSAEFLGSALPTHGAALATRLGLGRGVTVDLRLEHQGGNRVLNETALYQCVTLLSCRAALDPATPLEEQAAVVAARRVTPAGFLEDGAFTRLREASVTLAAPSSLLRMTGAGGMDLVIAGRNLLTLTGYSGLDPETNFTGGADPLASAEFLTQPIPRTIVVRLEMRR